MWLLVIEDDTRLASLLRRGLEAEGYQVDVASDGLEGEDMARLNPYDALVVDWRLPGRDGLSVVTNLRRDGFGFAILMLTVLDDVDHRIAGLDAGADDYLAKPFSFEELLARIRALLRRPRQTEIDPVLRLGALSLNRDRRSAAVGPTGLLLRPKEYALLEVLLRSPEVVLSRTVLAERVWGNALWVTDNVIDVTLSGLRHKLQDAMPAAADDSQVSIETVRGVGYRLRLGATK